MKILIITAYTPSWESFAKFGRTNKNNYCLRNGYDFICYNDGFDETRAVSWSKIKFIQKHLPSYDWIFWSDADSLITNFNTRLESFLDEKFNIIIGHYCNGLNCGEFFVKNCPWSYEFLEAVWNYEPAWDSPIWEQTAFFHFIEKSEIKEKIKLVPNVLFNAGLIPGWSWPERSRHWMPGDFIIHFAGLGGNKVFLKQSYGEFFDGGNFIGVNSKIPE